MPDESTAAAAPAEDPGQEAEMDRLQTMLGACCCPPDDCLTESEACALCVALDPEWPCPNEGECPSCHTIAGHPHTDYCQAVAPAEYPGQPDHCTYPRSDGDPWHWSDGTQVDQAEIDANSQR